MTWRMMQWLLTTIFVILSPAELRVSKQTPGQQSSHPVPQPDQPATEADARHLQDCEVIGWAELCERKKLTAGSCFQLQPTVTAPLCELQGPHGAPVQLRPATAEILTLTSGELRITGQIHMSSLRLAAKTVSFADAHVEAWHEAPADPNSNVSGGAFFSEASFTLTRSRLTVRGAGSTMDGGGLAAEGDLNVRQDSKVVIENVSAMSGAGFHVKGNVHISENSTVLIRNARCSKHGGGFSTLRALQVTNSSVVSLENVSTGKHGGGFLAFGEVEIAGNSTVNMFNSHCESGNGGGFGTGKGLKVSIGSRLIIRNSTAGRHGGGFDVQSRVLCQNYGGGFNALGEVEIAGKSTINISNSRAEAKNGGGFDTEKGLKVSTGSRLVIRNAFAGKYGGGFYAQGKTTISRSTVSIQNATARQIGGGFCALDDVVIDEMSSVRISNSRSLDQGRGFQTEGDLQVANSSVVSLQDVTAGSHGGGFVAREEVEIAGNSTVNISNSRATSGNGGGFDTEKGLKVSTGSRLVIRNASAGNGGGFYASGKTLISRSTVSIQNAAAWRLGGGFDALHEVVIDEMSSVSISDSRSAGQGGGFQADRRLQVTNSSVVSLENVSAREHGGGFVGLGGVEISGNSTVSISKSRAGSGNGGGFNALGGVEIAGNSTVNISNSRAESRKGGGFYTEKGLKVSTGSRLVIRNASAGQFGGGFYASGKTTISRSTLSIQNATARQFGGGFLATYEVVIDEMSSVRISNSRSGWGGGFHTDRSLQVANSSVVSLENVSTDKSGGGFVAREEVEIAGNSTVNISNSRATSGDGGGFDTEKGLKVSTGSRLVIWNATAGISGGGFYARGKTLISRSTLSIQDATARQLGGGFLAEGLALVNASTVVLLSTHAGADGGAFSALGLSLHGSSMSIGNSTALGSGSAGRVDGQVLFSSQSNLVVKDTQGLDNSSVLAASCLHLRDRSNVLFDGLVGGHGVELDNSGCSAVCSNNTFHVAEDATLNASGRLSSGLLSVAACEKEKVRLSGIHLHSWSSSLLSTRPSSVVVDQVTIDYDPPINNLQVLAAKDSFEIDSLNVSCWNCTWGVTLHETKDRSLKAVSSEDLQCPETVTVSEGLTHRCNCSNYKIAAERFRDVDMVPLKSVCETCVFCKPHFHYQNGDCSKCGIFTAWSDGKEDVCHVLPHTNSTELVALLTVAAVVVILTFFVFEILYAPLVILDAKSNLADPTEAESDRTFMLSVQGPIVDLHKCLSRLVHRWVRYQAKGTGLMWLDSDQKKIKVCSIARKKMLLQDTNPPFDCAACKGSLHATETCYLLSLFTACISAGAMLPAIITVAFTSGNGVGHVFVTTVYLALPSVALAALLHFPVAWLIQRLYRRTPFSDALDDYRKQINRKALTDPDATHPPHPRNQGLQVLTLRGLWKHFESYVLERNMHFVVANIVTPLTHDQGVSFVTLWGGRRVDYFVSHCWGTSFPHFVQSIQCHALSKEGTSWIDASYWICSFANNQWNIEAALGSDPMQSAFALALTAGIKGVAMVLDQEVQPLTRVWCLFEFFLSSREQLDLVFVTNAGVIGDDGCSSFDIALEVGKKIESLQVATCEASSEKDKKYILEYIISELGSLERMDDQIRKLMVQMLMQNLANVERATGSLVNRLGQGSATVVALNEERSESHVASGTRQIVSI